MNRNNSSLTFSTNSNSTSSSGTSYSYSNSSDLDFDNYSDLFVPYYDATRVKVKQEHNAVSEVIKNEAYCFNIQKFAEKLVEATFIEANKILSYKKEIKFPKFNHCDVYYENYFGETIRSKTEYDSTSHFWPKITEFNIKLGMEKVESFVNKWERSSDWKFCVEFLGFECEDCSNIFIYQVEWSKPTMSYPIPQATANVFFALDVYKMVPYNYTSRVEVSYIFECSTLIHRPGKINFQEKWLEDILEAKLKFFKTITFSITIGKAKTAVRRDLWMFEDEFESKKLHKIIKTKARVGKKVAYKKPKRCRTRTRTIKKELSRNESKLQNKYPQLNIHAVDIQHIPLQTQTWVTLTSFGHFR